MIAKRMVLGLVVIALLAAVACGGGGGKKAKVFGVEVDGATDAFTASFIGYFPNEIQAHPGDTVDFHSNFTGEPHTVTLGTDVGDVFDIIAQACPNGIEDPACEAAVTEGGEYAARYEAADAKLPYLLPDDPSQPISQAAGQPCFLATGDPPADGTACTEQTQTDFDGTQTFFNSGYLEQDQQFTVKLSDDIAAGTYMYYCLLHREGMTGTITVVDKDTDVPSPDEVTAAGEAQLGEMVTGLQPEVDRLATLTAEEAMAGSFSEEVQEATINEFAPKEIDVAAGDAVTWTVLGVHTIAFNAPESARPLLTKASDGTVSLNEEAVTPAIISGPPELGPDEAPPDPLVIEGGAYDGQGFASTGLIEAFEGTVQYTMTFSTAGTYAYICLIHPDMEGTITVQ